MPRCNQPPHHTRAAQLVALALLTLAATAVTVRTIRLSPQSSDKTPPTLRLNPNTAPPEALLALPGIGPVRLAAITTARDERPFDTPDDLDRRVPGIGPKTLDRLIPHLRFDHDEDAPLGADPQ